MQHVVDIKRLVEDGWITSAQAKEIARRSRETMVALAVNTLLCAGIIAATFGLIFWLADALAVAAAGVILLVIGGLVLVKGSELYRMLGNASAIVGAGMLVGGAGIELADTFRELAEPMMIFAGALIAAAAYLVFSRGRAAFSFAAGSVMLMGAALHLSGVALATMDLGDWAPVMVNGYAAVLIAVSGILVNVRFVTALAIAPFAQMLDTGTQYFHATYVFYSPESTLTVLQMTVLIGTCLWIASRVTDRYARHAGILAIMAAVVANLAFLVGSLWGDHVGLTYSEFPNWDNDLSWQENQAIRDAFRAQFFTISEHVYSVVWAMVLAGAALWAAHGNKRGLFNAAMTFGGIHAYTQVFETMADEPVAYAFGGLAAIPLAWGIWRLNLYLASRNPGVS